MRHDTTPMPRYDITHATRSELCAAGFLARYSGGTLDIYRIHLRSFFQWAANQGFEPLDAHRSQIELYGRWCETTRGNLPQTVANKLGILRSYYEFAVIDEYLPKSPAAHIRLPKFFADESSRLGLDRAELGALIATARASTPVEWALITLMGMLGLRVSEACNVHIEDYAHTERGHRVLKLVGKGNKAATIPLTIPVLRALDAAAGDRTEGILLLRDTIGTQMTKDSSKRILRRLCKKAGITKVITNHDLRHAYITACLDAGIPLRDVQIAARHSDPRLTARYDRARGNLDRHANHILTAFLAGAA